MHVDGEPQPLAVEAQAGPNGWARVLVIVGGGEYVKTDVAGNPRTRTLHGVVTLVRIKE